MKREIIERRLIWKFASEGHFLLNKEVAGVFSWPRKIA